MRPGLFASYCRPKICFFAPSGLRVELPLPPSPSGALWKPHGAHPWAARTAKSGRGLGGDGAGLTTKGSPSRKPSGVRSVFAAGVERRDPFLEEARGASGSSRRSSTAQSRTVRYR